MSSDSEHSSGCFGISCWLKRKKRPLQEEESPPSEVQVGKEQVPVLPTKKQYVIQATKKTMEILQGVSSLIPVPLVREVLDIGLGIINACEAVNEVEEKVAELKNRVAEFLLVIAKAAKGPETNPLADLSEDIMEELKDLKECLSSITSRLQLIAEQDRLLTSLLPDASMKTIEDCAADFQAGIDRFQTLRGLHAAQDLTKIQGQLQDIYGLTKAVAQKVDRIEEQMQGIKSSVDDLIAMRARKTPGGMVVPLAKMPRPPPTFLGRHAVVNAIAEQLTRNDEKLPRVCILAPGGMGKTSTALAVIDHEAVKKKFSERHRLWVPCISANSPGAFLSLLASRLQITRQADDPLQAIITTLEASEEPQVILLDNFETPWHPVEGSVESVKNILEGLDSVPNVAIIVTMRSDAPPLPHWTCEQLNHITLEDSRQIYLAIHASASSDPKLDDLLKALGCLPYAVTLMATRGERSLSTPGTLLLEWNTRGTDILPSAMDRSIQLSAENDAVTSSPDAVRLLQVLSMLPAGLLRSELDFWIQSYHFEAIEILRDAALVLVSEAETENTEERRLFVLPVVQSYMHQRGRISDSVRQDVFNACCRFLNTHRSPVEGPNDSHFKNDIAAITAQAINVDALLTEMVKFSTTRWQEKGRVSSHSELLPRDGHPNTSASQPEELDALLVYSWYQYWTRPQTQIVEYAATLARHADDSRRLAEAIFCHARILFRLNVYADAHELFKEAKSLFAGISMDSESLLSEVESIHCLWRQGAQSSTLLNRMSQVQACVDPKRHDPVVSALILFYTGGIHWYDDDYQKALEELQEAKALLAGLNKPLEVADCLYRISRCFGAMEQYPSALEVADEAIKHYDSLLGMRGRGFGMFVHIAKARFLKAMDIWDDNLYATLRVALEQSQEFGIPLAIAQSLEELGELYTRRKDWTAARLAYLEALKECSIIASDSGRRVARISVNNLEYIKVKEVNDETHVTFLIPPRY